MGGCVEITGGGEGAAGLFRSSLKTQGQDCELRVVPPLHLFAWIQGIMSELCGLITLSVLVMQRDGAAAAAASFRAVLFCERQLNKLCSSCFYTNQKQLPRLCTAAGSVIRCHVNNTQLFTCV